MVFKNMLPANVDLYEEIDKASGTLGMLGLSQYEARAYMALIAHGYGDAETISQTAQIPRTSSYKVLQSLQEKGFAIGTEGRPKIFKPEAPKVIRGRIEGKIADTFGKLELIHEVLSERGVPQLVYTITGKQKVIEKIGELLDKSTAKFIISTPVMSEIRVSLQRNIEHAVKRGIEVTVITAPTQRSPRGVRTFKKKGLIATDIISDGERALLASPDLNACGYTDNPALAAHLEQFLQILMEH